MARLYGAPSPWHSAGACAAGQGGAAAGLFTSARGRGVAVTWPCLPPEPARGPLCLPPLVSPVIWRARPTGVRVRARLPRSLGAGPTARVEWSPCRPLLRSGPTGGAETESQQPRALLPCLNPRGSQSVTYPRLGLWLPTLRRSC